MRHWWILSLVVTDSVTATAETAQNSTTADDAISSGQSAISQAQGALNTGLASYLSISKSLAASLSSVRSLLNSVSKRAIYRCRMIWQHSMTVWS